MSEEARKNTELPGLSPLPAAPPSQPEITRPSGGSALVVGDPDCPICGGSGEMYGGHPCMCTIAMARRTTSS